MPEEQYKAHIAAELQSWKDSFPSKKKPPPPHFPRNAEEKAAAYAQVVKMHNPLPMEPDYNRSINKSAAAQERKLGKDVAKVVVKKVAQLGKQKKQSVEPLIVESTSQFRAPPAGQYDPNNDPEFIELYGEKAQLYGLSITEFMRRMHEFDSEPHEVAYQYKRGAPLLKDESMIKELPTKMRRLHAWYMEACNEGKNYLYAAVKEEHFGHEPGNMLIEFPEFFQLFQGDALDKTLVTAYCL
jgi:hypothetical protein